MPRASLSEAEIDSFREALCEVATRRFAEHGYGGVSLRALAAELGCSPMTPYRYFRNKDEIFNAVRAAAFGRFADVQETARKEGGTAADRLLALGRAYLRFAREHPHAYRIMFELHQNPDPDDVELLQQERRAWLPLESETAALVEEGALAGDPVTVAHLFWAGLHGLVTLHVAGKLRIGRTLEELIEPMMKALFNGNTSNISMETP